MGRKRHKLSKVKLLCHVFTLNHLQTLYGKLLANIYSYYFILLCWHWICDAHGCVYLISCGDSVTNFEEKEMKLRELMQWFNISHVWIVKCVKKNLLTRDFVSMEEFLKILAIEKFLNFLNFEKNNIFF